MKPSSRELKPDNCDESFIAAKEKQNIIDAPQCFDKQKTKPQNLNFPRINTSKSFIIFKNITYIVKETSFKIDGEKDGINW